MWDLVSVWFSHRQRKRVLWECSFLLNFPQLDFYFLSFTLPISPLTNHKQVSRELLSRSVCGHRPVWPLWRPEPSCDWPRPIKLLREELQVADSHSVSKTKTQGVLPASVPQGWGLVRENSELSAWLAAGQTSVRAFTATLLCMHIVTTCPILYVL